MTTKNRKKLVMSIMNKELDKELDILTKKLENISKQVEEEKTNENKEREEKLDT